MDRGLGAPRAGAPARPGSAAGGRGGGVRCRLPPCFPAWREQAAVDTLLPTHCCTCLCPCRSDSGQSSSSETGRSSPTSGYEQVLRSRSPCAVLFPTEEPAPPVATVYAPQLVAPASAVLQQEQQQQAQQQGSQQQAALLPPLPPDRPLARASPLVDGPSALGAAADADSPFLGVESAVSYKEIEVQAAAASGRASALGSALGSLGCRSDSSSSTQALAAAVAAAVADDPVCAAAASQSLFANGGAGAGGTWASPSTASGGSGALAAEASAPSPFARLSLQQHPSVIAPMQPTSLLHQAMPLPPGIASSGSSASSPTAPAAHSRSGSVSELSRRGSLDGWGTSPHLSEGHAAEELFYRLNHARQTVEFVKRQVGAARGLLYGPPRVLGADCDACCATGWPFVSPQPLSPTHQSPPVLLRRPLPFPS